MPQKLIFSNNDVIDKNAYLNWRTKDGEDIQNLLALADGFMKSAIELSKICIEDNLQKQADILIFTILANVNHGIELYLKSTLWTLNKLLKNGRKIEGRHNIKQIFQTVKARAKDLKGDKYLKSYACENINLNEYIDELFSLITIDENNKDQMDFSRYSMTTEYKNHFYIESLENVIVDLENFALRFTEIHKKLKDISEELYFIELKEIHK